MKFNNIFPSDVAALKQRISPWVTLVDAIVARTPTVPRDTRAGWRSFAGEWAQYLTDEGTFFSPQRYERGLELEAKLRDWRSALSSQCPGIPAPAPKRASPFFGTWATPDEVRAQKVRVDPLLRDINERVAACSTADPALRKAWSDFFRGWTLFFNTEDAWIHGATQFECAQAYEDSVSEWREAVEGGCVAPAPPGQPAPGAAQTPSAPPGSAPSVPPQAWGPPPGAPGAWGPPPPGAWWPGVPAAATPAPRNESSALGANLAVSFGMLVLGFAMAKARTR